MDNHANPIEIEDSSNNDVHHPHDNNDVEEEEGKEVPMDKDHVSDNEEVICTGEVCFY